MLLVLKSKDDNIKYSLSDSCWKIFISFLFLKKINVVFFKVFDSEDVVNGIDSQIVNDFINANSGLIFNELDNAHVQSIEKNHYVIGKDIEIDEKDNVDSVLKKFNTYLYL
ncbi:hypothetical protein DAHU10_018540 [Hanseniaspora uvarum]|nr:hypothetical protein DAHU10_018540 [Hanseniaspora uvarum]